MNRQAIALAADSAVTVTGEGGVKIFTSAHKIFALSKYEPVGVMIYGTASLMSMPWETVIKDYRNELGRKTFGSVEQYSEHFIDWLGDAACLSAAMKQRFVRDIISRWLEAIRQAVLSAVAGVIEEQGELDEAHLPPLIDGILKGAEDLVASTELRPHPEGTADRFAASFGDEVEELIASTFEVLPLTGEQRHRLSALAGQPLLRGMGDPGTGVVIAGFGSDEYMPHLQQLMVEGVVLDRPIYRVDEVMEITSDHEQGSFVHGFAQADVISLFMEGVAPDYQRFVQSYLGNIIDEFARALEGVAPQEAADEVRAAIKGAREKLKEEFVEELDDQRYNEYIEPVLDVVQSLPKDELAGLAESLVNLTSLKRRISRDDETVGGPVDVALITKGDGLIWMRRKHYFDPSLNPQFFANYYRGPDDE